MVRKKTVGVLGGMGPEATVDFMATVVAMTPASTDQDHVHMIVDNDPSIPPRQDALLRAGADPGPAMADMARRLQSVGADFLVMPCNTAHAYSKAVTAVVGIPLLSIIDVTVAACRDYEAVGLLTTEGCFRSGIYQEALQALGKEPVLPTADELSEFTDLVFCIKQGDKSEPVRKGMLRMIDALQARGAQAIIAGCTEIPLVIDKTMSSVPLVSSTDELARQTIAFARGVSAIAT
ncbi:MAG: aspartate/glutamate racemase family protein [Woeseiaceae bacterium]